MADTKISALPVATTPLAGTEVLPIVQSGSTVKVAVSDLTAGRAVSASSLSLTGSPLPTTSGGTALTSFTANKVIYSSSTSALSASGSLNYNGTHLGVGSTDYGDAGTIDVSIGVAGSTAGGLQLWAGTTQEHYIQWGDAASGAATYSGAISYSHNGDFMRFWTGSTERWRIDSGGNLIQKIANKGINFTANSAAAGMTSQLLNWYEEGTWTPVFTCATPGNLSFTYASQSGTYTRVGRQVTVTCAITSGAAMTYTTASGGVKITGLPFTPGVTAFSPLALWRGFTSAGYMTLSGQVVGTVAAIYLNKSGSGVANAAVDITDFPTGGTVDLYFTITYFV